MHPYDDFDTALDAVYTDAVNEYADNVPGMVRKLIEAHMVGGPHRQAIRDYAEADPILFLRSVVKELEARKQGEVGCHEGATHQ